jgi:hypothetical protein
MPGAVVEATLAASPAGVIALVVFVPAIASAGVARAMPPTCVGEARASEIEPLVTLMPPVGLTMTPPNCVVEAADRLMVIVGVLPPPVKPVPTLTVLMVPVPGAATLIVPSAAM